MTTQQIKLWEGVFGDSYQERNQLTEEEVSKRLIFLENIYKVIYTNCNSVPKSVLEVGAGQGPNLVALEKLSIKLQTPIKLFATETNQKARLALSENAPSVEILTDIPREPCVDLVLTYGVLIHTHPAHLRPLLRALHGATKRWLLCVEYFSPTTRALPYRGEKDALWLDDYGSHWLDNFNLKSIGYGFCWKKNTGLDNVTFHIFEKMEKTQ